MDEAPSPPYPPSVNTEIINKTSSLAGSVFSAVQKIIALIFFLSVVFFIASLLMNKYPLENEILADVVNNEPEQLPTSRQPFKVNFDEFTYDLTPKYDYDIYGVVVTYFNYDSLLNIVHKYDPGNVKDLCVVWGKNIKNSAYRHAQYGSSEFFCWAKWDPTAVALDLTKLSNNHVIPATEKIRSIIDQARAGDQIHMQGYLVNYSVSKNGEGIFSRNTSTTRLDTGNGACEVLYVTSIEILKKNSSIAAEVNIYSKSAMYLSFIIGTFILFVLRSIFNK